MVSGWENYSFDGYTTPVVDQETALKILDVLPNGFSSSVLGDMTAYFQQV